MRLRRWRVRKIFRLLIPHLSAPSVVVDAGCGPGFADDELLRSVAPVTISRLVMIDPQRGMVELAERGRTRALVRFGPARVAVADGIALPLRDASADVVLSLGVLCCMEEEFVDQSVREAHRVLRPGGYYLLAVPRRRGEADESRLTRLGFVREGGYRPGRALFRKPL